MSDTSFGSGLSFGSGGPQDAGASADVPLDPRVSANPSPAPSPAPAPQSSSPGPFQAGGVFGGSLGWGGPRYTPADPNATPQEQATDLLQQRLDRANKIATDPLVQFFNPEGAAKARAFVPQAAEQLAKLKQYGAQQQEIQKLGANYGINSIPQGADRETATNLIADELQKRYLNGDPLAAQGLAQLGRNDLVQAGTEQHLSAATANNKRYTDAIGKLSMAPNAGQYAIVYNQLKQETQDGTHTDAELASVPKTYAEFQQKKQQISNALIIQQKQLEAQQAHLTQLGGVTPILKTTDKDGNATGLHAAIASQVTDDNGQPLKGVEPVTVGGIYNGNRLPYGSDKIQDAGVKWGTMPSSEVAEANKRMEPHKADIERAAGINKLDAITQDKAFGTNPWLLGHGIDQFVEISRNGVGGKGSATPGTISIMENLRGALQTSSDKVQKEWGRVVEWVDGGKKGPQPYLSTDTVNALKSAVSTLRTASNHEMSGTVGQTAYYVGRHGGKLADLSLEPGVMDAVKSYWQQGNNDFKKDIASRPSVVMGGQRIVFDRAGVKPPQAVTPGGFDSDGTTPQQHSGTAPTAPGARTAAASASPSSPPGGGATPPATPGNPTPGSAAGGGGPVTIAGATINPPPIDGASPNYLSAVQRIESGNERTPWQAGNGVSSAKGAFQIIGQTWKDNRPAGAPDDPRQATPQQQAEAAANYANKNSAALKSAGLPVNDTTLYAAHNLGAGGASALLRAAPNADARTVVGEAAARNNPLFFKGRPTVAMVLARYQNEVEKGGATGGNVADVARHRAAYGRNGQPPQGYVPPPAPPISGPNVEGQNGAGSFNTGRTDIPGGETDIIQKTAANAPAIGGTAGAIAGGPAGGAAGGAAGQMLQNYMNGQPMFQPNVIGSGAFGAAGGITTGGATGALLRAGMGAAGGAAQGGLEGGTVSGAIKGGVEAGAGSVIGEGAGRGTGIVANLLDRFGGFLGMGGHQTFSRLTQDAQQSYLDAARTVAAGKPEKPVTVTGAPKNPAAETAYEEKLADYEDAERHMKEVLPHVKPEEGAYAAQQVGNERGEATTGRPLAAEKAAVGKGYEELRNDVTAAGEAKGITAVKARGTLPDGPMSQLRTADNPTGKISNTYAPEMQHAEMLATAPAPNAAARWDNILKARSELLEQERTALGGASPDKTKAKAMRAGADALYPEVERTATALFGKEGAPAVMQRLDTLDARYARVMKLSSNGDLAGTIAKGGKEGRDAQQAFNALAGDDPTAQRLMNALVRLKKGTSASEVSLMLPVITGELSGVLPTSGVLTAAVTVAKLTQLAHDYMARRGAGQPIKMDQLLNKGRLQAFDTAAAGRTGASVGSRAGTAVAQQPPAPPLSY